MIFFSRMQIAYDGAAEWRVFSPCQFAGAGVIEKQFTEVKSGQLRSSQGLDWTARKASAQLLEASHWGVKAISLAGVFLGAGSSRCWPFGRERGAEREAAYLARPRDGVGRDAVICPDVLSVQKTVAFAREHMDWRAAAVDEAAVPRTTERGRTLGRLATGCRGGRGGGRQRLALSQRGGGRQLRPAGRGRDGTVARQPRSARAEDALGALTRRLLLHVSASCQKGADELSLLQLQLTILRRQSRTLGNLVGVNRQLRTPPRRPTANRLGERAPDVGAATQLIARTPCQRGQRVQIQCGEGGLARRQTGARVQAEHGREMPSNV